MRKLRHAAIAAGAASAFIMSMESTPAWAQADPFVGQLMLVGFSFCPRGWAEAEGQLLSISGNSALFSLYGTTYGGDGRTTFALPDLRGRGPIGQGQGPGLPSYRQGQAGGSTSLTVTIQNLPSHSHPINATNQSANLPGPGTDFLARNTDVSMYHNGPANVQMDPGMVGPTGGNLPIEKRSPFLAMRWCVALQGTFPSRP